MERRIRRVIKEVKYNEASVVLFYYYHPAALGAELLRVRWVKAKHKKPPGLGAGGFIFFCDVIECGHEIYR